MILGVDYAFDPHPPVAAMAVAGVEFAARYMSPSAANDANGKNLVKAELAALRAAGLSVVVVEESAANRMLGGHAAGVADGQHADAVTRALGMTGAVCYFACDFDATQAQQAAVNAYLDGAASVITVARTGIYGGFYPVKRALDGGHAKWAWQTTAWSGGQWDSRAHIRQAGSVSVAGITIDVDEAMTADYGQWPRPAAPVKPAPPPVPAYAVPARVSGTVHPAVNFSWDAAAPVSPHWRLQVADDARGAPGAVLPDGTVVTTTNHASVALPAPGKYWVRVQAAGNSPFSKWQPFTA
jgi:hypothetical protein